MTFESQQTSAAGYLCSFDVPPLHCCPQERLSPSTHAASQGSATQHLLLRLLHLPPFVLLLPLLLSLLLPRPQEHPPPSKIPYVRFPVLPSLCVLETTGKVRCGISLSPSTTLRSLYDASFQPSTSAELDPAGNNRAILLDRFYSSMLPGARLLASEERLRFWGMSHLRYSPYPHGTSLVRHGLCLSHSAAGRRTEK